MTQVNNLTFLINDRLYEIRTGQEVKLALEGEIEHFGKAGDTAAIIAIQVDGQPYEAEVRLQRTYQPHSSWEDGQYLTLWVGDLIRLFSFHETGPMIVNRDFVFKKTNLKGMKCKIITNLGERDAFVEMENDIGGGSCDGIGRQGYCIPIKKEFLSVKKKKEKGEI